MPIYVFSSIMRTLKDGASSGTEEPEYYVKYGQAIANYTKIDNADISGLNESYQVTLRRRTRGCFKRLAFPSQNKCGSQ